MIWTSPLMSLSDLTSNYSSFYSLCFNQNATLLFLEHLCPPHLSIKIWESFCKAPLVSSLSAWLSPESESHSVVSDSLWPHGLYSPRNSAGQNYGVGSHSLLQGIFPTQGSNPGLLHYRQILYQLSHKKSPRILEWVAVPFSRGSSQSRNRTKVSCIAGGLFFTNWAIREAPEVLQISVQMSPSK